jgi:hypothetical protein
MAQAKKTQVSMTVNGQPVEGLVERALKRAAARAA